ncbi:ribosome maturation factor RimM [Alteribacillus sp. HJP-4]|uniref:ribosome maturation factor RimM n=1 Tax=Alteribacillus sp. HJP-4 TaxID=2775394 RepID=UPI0035CD2E0B
MEWFNVGNIVNTHGVKGEVRVLATTDFSEERFKEGNILYASKNGADEHRRLTVRSSRQHKQFILLTFNEIPSLTEAEALKGATLQIEKTELGELDEGEYYHYEIIDCIVYTDEGEKLGRVKEILTPGANDVWVVQAAAGGRDILLPYIEDVVKEVNINEKKIIAHVLEGLLPE